MTIPSSYMDLIPKCESMQLFANEVIQFLTENAHLWIECPTYFIIAHTPLTNPVIFKDEIQKAVLTIAYFLRSKVNRDRFRQLFPVLKKPQNFVKYLTRYMLPDKGKHFSGFILWVASVCFYTMLMYQKGYYFIELSRMCLAQYSEFEDFHKTGGWERLKIQIIEISLRYDHIAAVLKNEEYDDNISKLLNAVEIVERRERYLSSAWVLRNPDMPLKDKILSETTNKYTAVMKLGPERVSSAYTVVLTNVFQDCKERTMEEYGTSDKLPALEATEGCLIRDKESIFVNASTIEKNISMAACDTKSLQRIQKVDSFPIASVSNAMYDVNTDNINRVPPDALDDINSIFVISSLFLDQREEAKHGRHGRPPYKRVLKIRSSAMETDKISLNLTELLDNYLENRLYSEMSDGVFAVGPSKNLYDENSRIIVIDTSSEEEEDEEIFLNGFTTLLESCSFLPNGTGISVATRSLSQDDRRFINDMTQSESGASGHTSEITKSQSGACGHTSKMIKSQIDSSGHTSEMTKSQSSVQSKRKTMVKKRNSGKKQTMAHRTLQIQSVQTRSTESRCKSTQITHKNRFIFIELKMCWTVNRHIFVLLLFCTLLLAPFSSDSVAQQISRTVFHYDLDSNYHLFYGLAAFLSIYIFIGYGIHIHVWPFALRTFFSARLYLEQVETPSTYAMICFLTFMGVTVICANLVAHTIAPPPTLVMVNVVSIVYVGVIFTVISVAYGRSIFYIIGFIVFLYFIARLCFPSLWTHSGLGTVLLIFIKGVIRGLCS